MRLVPLATTCARPACSTTSGVLQVVCSSRAAFQRVAPVRASKQTRAEPSSWSKFKSSASPWTTGVTASPQPRRVVGLGRLGALREARVHLGQFVGAGDAVGLDGGGDEDLIAPDDRGGAAAAGQGGFPADVSVRVPGDGRVASRGDAVVERAAPV